MKIVVLADEENFETIRQLNTASQWIRATDVKDFASYADAYAYFNLMEDAIETDHPILNRPLFVHSVTTCLPVGSQAIRINAWNGFLQNTSWEVAGNITDAAKEVLAYLNKKIIICANDPGFIAARIIAMIINEAYYAKEENVSTESEIDTAMKLGTNYPYGPFEWSKKIGVKNIYSLLKELSLQDERYTPSTLLTKTAAQ